LNGIPGTGGIAGYLNVIDCRVDGIFAEGPVNTDAGPEFNIWQNAAQEFEYQFFGCAGDGGAGVGFALVPPILYGMPMGQADLKLLGDWYVTSLIQAVANQSESNAQAVLTGPQIDAIEAEMAYQETLYPDIVPTSGYLYSTCPSDAGADGSGD
jgi:hypothetical protein